MHSQEHYIYIFIYKNIYSTCSYIVVNAILYLRSEGAAQVIGSQFALCSPHCCDHRVLVMRAGLMQIASATAIEQSYHDLEMHINNSVKQITYRVVVSRDFDHRTVLRLDICLLMVEVLNIIAKLFVRYPKALSYNKIFYIHRISHNFPFIHNFLASFV